MNKYLTVKELRDLLNSEDLKDDMVVTFTTDISCENDISGTYYITSIGILSDVYEDKKALSFSIDDMLSIDEITSKCEKLLYNIT